MKSENFEIEQETGENLQQITSEVLVKDAVEAVKELGSNSYDADAEKFVLNINLAKREILAEDDGSGMSEDGLDDFLRAGDSVKIANPISPKGRKRIGKFGIAKVLLEFLGGMYELNTWCGNTHIIGEERFGKRGTKGLEYDVSKNSAGKTGTSIFIRGAYPIRLEQLSTQRLKNALTWEMPNEPDFKIWLNGNQLVRINGKPDKKFAFKDNLPLAGGIDMEVQYFSSPPRTSGVFVYVNKRAVGGSQGLTLECISKDFLERIFVSVNADSLQDSISFNRAQLKQDNEIYSDIKSWVYGNLLQVRSAVGVITGRVRKGPIAPIDQRVREVLEELHAEARPSSKGGDYKIDRVRKFVGVPSITLVARKGVLKPQAEIDTSTGEFQINVDNPWFNSPETSNREVLKMHTILAQVFELAWRKEIKENIGGIDKRERFYNLCTRLLRTPDYIGDISARAVQDRETGVFVPFRRYDIAEITGNHISLVCLNALANAGVVEVHNNTILGSELNEYMKIAIDHTPALELVKQCEERRINRFTGKPITRERARQKYSGIDDILEKFGDRIPFVCNIGKTHPFFLVRNENVPSFLGLYSQGALRRNINHVVYVEKIKPLFDKLCKEDGDKKQEYVGVETLCDIANRSPCGVFEIISYAQRKGISLLFEEQGGVVRYSRAGFRKAQEAFLIGRENE